MIGYFKCFYFLCRNIVAGSCFFPPPSNPWTSSATARRQIRIVEKILMLLYPFKRSSDVFSFSGRPCEFAKLRSTKNRNNKKKRGVSCTFNAQTDKLGLPMIYQQPQWRKQIKDAWRRILSFPEPALYYNHKSVWPSCIALNFKRHLRQSVILFHSFSTGASIYTVCKLRSGWT